MERSSTRTASTSSPTSCLKVGVKCSVRYETGHGIGLGSFISPARSLPAGKLTEAATAAGVTYCRAAELLNHLQEELADVATLEGPLERWARPSQKGIPKPRKQAA
jgi:hypothetical protein